MARVCPAQTLVSACGVGENAGGGNGESGPVNGGQGDQGAPEQGAVLQPVGRAGFSDQLAQAADGFGVEMSRLAAAMEQAAEASAA